MCGVLLMANFFTPHTTVAGKLDQALAARNPNLRWHAEQEGTP
jgi:hypothetical protein